MSQRSIRRNTLVLSVTELGNRVCSALVVFLLARAIGDSGFGQYSLGFAIAGIFALIADFGLSRLVVREVAREALPPTQALLAAALVKLPLTLLALAGAFATTRYLDYPAATVRVVMLAVLAALIQSYAQLCRSVFQARQRMELDALGRAAERSLALLLTALLAWLALPLELFMIAFVVASLSDLALSLRLLLPLIERRAVRTISPGLLRRLAIEALPFFLTGFFITVYFRIDTIILSTFAGVREIGWYNAAYIVLLNLQILPQALSTALYPALARQWSASKADFERSLHGALEANLAIGVLLSVVTLNLAPLIVALLFGASFGPAAELLAILAPVIALASLSSVAGSALGATNTQRSIVLVTAAGAASNIAINLALIPIFGATGSALSTMLTEALILCLYLILLRRRGIAIDRRLFAQVIVFVLLCGGIGWQHTLYIRLISLVFVAGVLSINHERLLIGWRTSRLLRRRIIEHVAARIR
jgi:O-antigen/teichoic acid export membrane protein